MTKEIHGYASMFLGQIARYEGGVAEELLAMASCYAADASPYPGKQLRR